jgi:malate permease and related proteins
VLDVFLEVVLPVLAIAVVGGAVGRRLGLSIDTMSKAVFYLFSPSLVFTSIATTEVSGDDMGRLFAVAAIVFLVNGAAASIWSVARGSDRATAAAALLSGCIINQGNLGLPMARLAFGQAGLDVAIVLFVISVVLWSTAGIAFGALVRGAQSRRGALLAPFRYPSIYAAIAGGVVNATDVELPVAVSESTRTLGQAAIPAMLVVLGLQFVRPRLDGLVEPMAATANRLLLGPLVAWPFAAMVGLGGVTGRTAVMMAGMPTAVMSTIIAIELDARPEVVVRTVVLSTILSVASLTVLIALLR